MWSFYSDRDHYRLFTLHSIFKLDWLPLILGVKTMRGLTRTTESTGADSVRLLCLLPTNDYVVYSKIDKDTYTHEKAANNEHHLIQRDKLW